MRGAVVVQILVRLALMACVLTGFIAGALHAQRSAQRPAQTPQRTSSQTSVQHESLLIDSLRTVVETAIVRGQWPAVDSAIVALRQAAIGSPENRVLQYDLGYALHRRATAMLDHERKPAAKPLLQEADRALTRAVALGAGGSALALRGAVTGQLTAVSGTINAMRLGPKSFQMLDEAVRIAPEDPRVALLNGITRLNAPRPFGGGPERGERELRRAITLFRTDSTRSPAPTWGRADAHIWLGIALARQGRKAEARAAYEDALAIAPDHAWVKGTLLPALDETRRAARR